MTLAVSILTLLKPPKLQWQIQVQAVKQAVHLLKGNQLANVINHMSHDTKPIINCFTIDTCYAILGKSGGALRYELEVKSQLCANHANLRQNIRWIKHSKIQHFALLGRLTPDRVIYCLLTCATYLTPGHPWCRQKCQRQCREWSCKFLKTASFYQEKCIICF